MGKITFTQYLRPNGRKVETHIDRPDEICAKAQDIVRAGYGFECEELMGGTVSLTISDEDGDADIELCANGPPVPDAVDRLVSRFAAHLAKLRVSA